MYGYFACFDAIAMGCCVALLSRSFRVSDIARRVTQLAACAFIASIYLHNDIDSSAIFGPTLIAAGAAVFLFAEGANRTSTAEAGAQNLFQRMFRPLAWFGSHSYELYLFHIVVLALMRSVYDRHSLPAGDKPLWFLVFLLLATLLANLVARLYSEPLNGWIRGRLVGPSRVGLPLRATE